MEKNFVFLATKNKSAPVKSACTGTQYVNPLKICLKKQSEAFFGKFPVGRPESE